MGITWKDLLRFGMLAVLVSASLMAALTTRFLLFGPSTSAGSSSYWDFVGYSIEAFYNALVPGFLLGLGCFLGYRVLLVAVPRFHRSLASDLVTLTLFFGLMGLVGVMIPQDHVFPRISWGLAWGFSLMGFAAFTISRDIGLGLQEKAPFSRGAQLFIDAAVIGGTLAFSYAIRFDGLPPHDYEKQFILVAPYVVLLYLVVNQLWGTGNFVWRFTSIREVSVIGLAVASAALVLMVGRILILEDYALLRIPFGILLVHAPLTFVGLISVRALRRVQFRYSISRGLRHPDRANRRRVLLVGAGDAGVQLIDELGRRRDFEIVGFLDDDPRKLKRVIHGVQVLGTTRQVREIVRNAPVDEVILAMPSVPRAAARRIVADCEAEGVKVSSVPSLSEILMGRVRVSRLRPVRIEDLLGRDSVEFPEGDGQLISAYAGKRILVTGAAGSIGSEIVRQLRDYGPESLLMLDKDENGLYEVALDLREHSRTPMLELMADVRDRRRLEQLFAAHRPEVVLHAAAYKHVPMMEHNPTEAIVNNVFGTRNVVELSVETGVERFLLISTDKAVNPTSVMGASKRIAEILMRDAALKTERTRLCCVRFGNVLGSRASVVPVFQKRIAQGRNIPVTHPEIKRYFMTIPEAVQLVLQAGSLAARGETFVLDMGDPVKIADLARDLIEQSGLVLGEDIDIEFTGLRPGEKMFEELLTGLEKGVRNTKYPKIFVAQPASRDRAQVEHALSRLETALEAGDASGIYDVFDSLNFGYRRRVVPMSKSRKSAV